MKQASERQKPGLPGQPAQQNRLSFLVPERLHIMHSLCGYSFFPVRGTCFKTCKAPALLSCSLLFSLAGGSPEAESTRAWYPRWGWLTRGYTPVSVTRQNHVSDNSQQNLQLLIILNWQVLKLPPSKCYNNDLQVAANAASCFFLHFKALSNFSSKWIVTLWSALSLKTKH